MLFLQEKASALGKYHVFIILLLKSKFLFQFFLFFFIRFPYIDTLKILEKFGPGCYFYGNGTSEDIDNLTKLLESGEKISALFCELPSNPLCKSSDLKK